MKEASWPSFIAAPFIWPSAPTIFIAVSRWRCSSRSLLALLGAGDVGRLGAGVAGALHADDRAQLGRAPHPALGDLRVRRPSAEGCHRFRFAPVLYPLPSDGQRTRNPEGRAPHASSARAPPAACGARACARRRLRRRRGGARLPGRRTRGPHRARRGRARSSTSSSRAAKPSRSWSRSSSCTRCAAASSTSTCRRCSLDEAIQAEVAIELEGAEDAPGVKEGGVLEHVTREITVEALPTEIPERIVADVSAMEINDTLQLSRASPCPRASSSSPTTPTRSRSPPSRRRASRKSPSPRSRRRPSWSARRARPPAEEAERRRGRRLGRLRRGVALSALSPPRRARRGRAAATAS